MTIEAPGGKWFSPEIISKNVESSEITNFEVMLDNALSDNKLSRKEQEEIVALLSEATEAQKEVLNASLEARKDVIIESIARRILIENDSVDAKDLLWNTYAAWDYIYESSNYIWRLLGDSDMVGDQDIQMMEKLWISTREVTAFMNYKSENKEYIEGIKEARNWVENSLRLLKAGKELWWNNLDPLRNAGWENPELEQTLREEFIESILEGYVGEEGEFKINSIGNENVQAYFDEIRFEDSSFTLGSPYSTVMEYGIKGSRILWLTSKELVAELNKRKN